MSTPYTIAQVLEIFRADLATWAAGKQGGVSIARDPWNVYELLAETGVNAVKAIVAWAGDTEFGGVLQQPLVAHDVEVVLAVSRGLAAQKDAGLLSGAGGREPLLDLVEGCRARVLGLRFPETITRRYVKYVGTEPVATPDGVPLAAYRLKFKLDATIAAVVYRDVA